MNANIELLIQKDIITREQVAQAEEEAMKTGLPLEKALENYTPLLIGCWLI